MSSIIDKLNLGQMHAERLKAMAEKMDLTPEDLTRSLLVRYINQNHSKIMEAKRFGRGDYGVPKPKLFKIKELREANNMTRRSLAGLLNVSEEQVRKWELGINYPNQGRITLLSRVFKCKKDDLYYGEED